MNNDLNYSKSQLTWLMILRLFIGWHFMFEGIVKILNPKWTAVSYLLDSQGFASDLFVKMTQNDGTMAAVNFLNEWALLLIGLGLTLGCLYRLSAVGGMIMLVMYTLSHPSFIGASYLTSFEGTYLWIDKNLVELAALGLCCVYPTSQVIGFDRVLARVCPALHKLKLI